MEWTLRPVRFPFVFLGRRLFSVPTPLHVLESHYSVLSDDPDRTPLPLEPGDGAAGAYIRSQPVAADLPRLQRTRGLYRYVPSHYDRHLIRMPGSFDEYLGKFSSKTRNTHKRRVKKLAELNQGREYFRVYSTPQEMAEFHRVAGELASRTYQARLYGNAFSQEAAFRDKLVRLADEGRTLGALLFLADKPIAFWWFTTHGKLVLSEYTGYEAEHRDLSPGLVLLYRCLEHLFAKGAFELFDFGEGDADYKQIFANHAQRCAEVFYFRGWPRNLGIISLDVGLAGCKRLLRPIEEELERRGLKSKLKRLIRA
jgi:hypothetical protein